MDLSKVVINEEKTTSMETPVHDVDADYEENSSSCDGDVTPNNRSNSAHSESSNCSTSEDIPEGRIKISVSLPPLKDPFK